MKVTFYSNFLNHHQLPFCEEMIKILGDGFKFVATEDIPEERKKLGYADMNSNYSFVIKSYEDEERAIELSKESDVVIIGSAPSKYMRLANEGGALCFRYTERIYKDGFNLKTWLSIIKNFTFKDRKNVYLLCSSAYTSNDFNRSFAYLNKAFKWGYFTEVKDYKNFNSILNKKRKNSILWVARFIKFKHPEVVIELAKRLKNEKYNFEINMIGIGELLEDTKILAKKYNVEKNINFLGSMSPEQVRKHMEQNVLFVFTSDRGEGWGAVLNEAMNSGCAVVASHAIGSVPFLIHNNINGLIYKDGDIDDFFNKVKYLLNNSDFTKKIGLNAYESMINLWNAKVAAERLVSLSNELINNKKIKKYDEGPCSIAYRLNDNWFKLDDLK